MLNPMTSGLVWSMMSVGLGVISEKNVGEFIFRLRLTDKLFGTMLSNDKGPMPISDDEVRAHIGLSTNVSDESRTTWVKRTLKHYERDLADTGRYEAEKAEDAKAKAAKPEAKPEAAQAG